MVVVGGGVGRKLTFSSSHSSAGNPLPGHGGAQPAHLEEGHLAGQGQESVRSGGR